MNFPHSSIPKTKQNSIHGNLPSIIATTFHSLIYYLSSLAHPLDISEGHETFVSLFLTLVYLNIQNLLLWSSWYLKLVSCQKWRYIYKYFKKWELILRGKLKFQKFFFITKPRKWLWYWPFMQPWTNFFFLSLYNEMGRRVFSKAPSSSEILWILSKFDSHHDGGGREWQMILHLKRTHFSFVNKNLIQIEMVTWTKGQVKYWNSNILHTHPSLNIYLTKIYWLCARCYAWCFFPFSLGLNFLIEKPIG